MQQRGGVPFGLLNLQNNPLFQTAGKSKFLESNINQVNRNDLKTLGKESIEKNSGGLSTDDIFKKTAPKVESLATDNKDTVDPNLTGLYDGSGDIAKIMGALSKLSKDDKADKLYQQLIDEKTTPEDAKAKVNKFFGVDKTERTPAWADAALAIGSQLLASPKPGQTTFQQFGTALAAGGVAVKAKKKEERAEDLAINKLAFGVYREDEKSRKTLATQYAKYKQKRLQDTTKLGLDLSKLFFDKKKFQLEEEKFAETQGKNYAKAVTDTIKTFPEEVRSSLFDGIQKDKKFLKGVELKDVPQAIFALAKANGIKTDNVKGSDIVKSEFRINTEPQFDRLKEAYKNLGWGTYDPSKTYILRGFKNKTKQALFTQAPNLEIEPKKEKTGYLGLLEERLKLKKIVNPSQEDLANLKFIEEKLAKETKLPDDRTGLRKEQDNLQALEREKQTVNMGGAGRPLNVINREIEQVKGRINKLVTTEKSAVYVGKDGSFYSGTVGPGGLDEIKNQNTIKDLENRQVNFVRAAYIGDKILYNLARPGAKKNVGLFETFANRVIGISNQITNFTNISAEDQAKYSGENIDNLIEGNTGNTSKTFAAFKSAAKGNQRLMSAVMDYAYALAGSRETGKLTDKDVAAALRTLGGEDLSEGKFFTNVDKLISGVSNALDLANNNLGVAMNVYLNKSYKMEKKRNPEVDENDYKFDPIALVKRISPDPTLHERLFSGKTEFSPQGLSYQKFEEYQKLHGTSSNTEGDNDVRLGGNSLSQVIQLIKNTRKFGIDQSGQLTQEAKDTITNLLKNLNTEERAKAKQQLGLN
jgi:hypothetical protein